jgi:hypothetical protein
MSPGVRERIILQRFVAEKHLAAYGLAVGARSLDNCWWTDRLVRREVSLFHGVSKGSV